MSEELVNSYRIVKDALLDRVKELMLSNEVLQARVIELLISNNQFEERARVAERRIKELERELM